MLLCYINNGLKIEKKKSGAHFEKSSKINFFTTHILVAVQFYNF